MGPDMLPVRVDPHPSEGLASYLGRLADANGLRRSAFVREVDMGRIAACTGLQLETLREMTLERYPPCVAGGTLRSRGWRVHARTWNCRSCTSIDGRRLRDWDLVFTPVCLNCKTLLNGDPKTETIHPASEEMVQTAACLGSLADRAITSDGARTKMNRLRSLVVLAGTLDSPQSSPGRHLTDDPAQAARWIVRAWAADTSLGRRAELVEAALQATEPAQRPALARYMSRSLRKLVRGWSGTGHPKRTAFEASVASPPRNSRALQREIHELSEQFAASGMEPRHIPAAHPRTQRPNTVTAAVHVLHALLTELQTGHRPDEAAQRHDLHTERSNWGAQTRNLFAGWGATSGQLAKVADLGETLLADGLIDYRRRRRILDQTRLTDPRLRTLTRAHHTTVDVANDWAWIHLTHGPVPDHRSALTSTRIHEADLTLPDEIMRHILALAHIALDESAVVPVNALMAGQSS